MQVFYLFLIFILSCYYAANPPSPSSINDIRPKLVLKLTGFSAGSRVYVRYWDQGIPYTLPSSFTQYTDASGRLQTEVVLSQSTLSADLLVYVDQNANGSLDAADFGTYLSAITIDTTNHYTYVNIPFSAGTLTAYSSLTALPATGRKVCVYMPPGATPYSTSMNSNLPAFPSFNGNTLVTSDWFPVGIVQPSGIVQTAPLLAAWIATLNEVCVQE